MSEYFRKPIVKTLMLKGQDAVSISNIEKKSTSGLTDTYEITLTDGTKRTFNVNNGKGIKSIVKTSTSGLVDTYTTTYNDGTTTTFTVKNGEKGDTGNVENLKIGGVNLLSDTKGMKQINGWKRINFVEDNEKYKGFTVLKNTTAGWSYASQSLNLEIGEKYVYSAYVKSSANNIIKFEWGNTSDTIVSLNDNTWHRVKKTFVATVNFDAPKITCNTVKKESFYICGIKLEKEETPSDWTPSIEDIESTYATKSEVTKNTNNISNLTSKVNAMNNVSSINTVANMLSAGTSASLGSNYQKTIYNIVVHNVEEPSSILFTLFGASISTDESSFDIVNPAGNTSLSGMCDVRVTMSDGVPSAQLIRVFDMNGTDQTNSYRMSIYSIQIG